MYSLDAPSHTHTHTHRGGGRGRGRGRGGGSGSTAEEGIQEDSLAPPTAKRAKVSDIVAEKEKSARGTCTCS